MQLLSAASKDQRRAAEGRKSQNERVVKYNEPLFHGQEPQKKAVNNRPRQEEQMLRKPSVDNVDFEKKLEESLKDL